MNIPTTEFLAQLQKYGIPYHEMPNWTTRNHGPLNLHAFTIHDSVTGSMTDDRAAQFCYDGRSDLAGPLYNILIGRNGTAYLLSSGKTWNIGATYRQRVDLAISAQMPYERELGAPPPDDWDGGNDVCAGISLVTPGAGPYTSMQFSATAKVCAALAHALGTQWASNADQAARSCIGHSEATSRKVDPYFDMGAFRREVKVQWTTPTPPPNPPLTTAWVEGHLPVLVAGMRDPVVGGYNHIARAQKLLDIPVTSIYDLATATAVKNINARLLNRTIDGRTIDDVTWERLYGIF